MPSFKTENAFLLSVQPLGERSYVLSVFTKEHGRFAGVLKAKKAPVIASFLSVRWQARLSEQLGTFYLDDSRSFYTAFLDDKVRLYILSSVCSLLNQALPERQTAEKIYDLTIALLNNLESPTILQHFFIWEIELLKALGFGLDFTQCAGGGSAQTLAFVSPKTGRAVSLEKGLPYKEKLLTLPRFLWKEGESATQQDLISAYTLTTYFFTMHMGLTRLPPMREQLFELLKKGAV